MPRKLSAIRQFSLQCETPPPMVSTRRASLKKQHSEELAELTTQPTNKDDAGIRISLSAKAALRTPKHPKHPIKVAWGDDEPGLPSQPRPQVIHFRRHSHHAPQTTYNDNKFHLAWQERENTKNKLNIFLQNFQPENNSNNIKYNGKECEEYTPSPRMEPKIMQPLLLHTENDNNSNSSSNLKQIFQKHLRKSKISSPSGSDSENMSQAVVVVPIIERNKPCTQNIVNQAQKRDKNVEPTPEPPVRPQTAIGTPSAQLKRAMFQKRTNSAFTSINTGCSSPQRVQTPQEVSPHGKPFRPPMIRASSLPTSTKPDIQVKTRLRRKIKLAKRGKHPNNKDNEDETKKLGGHDVVTMVSLVSPSESDEELEGKEGKEEKKDDELKTHSVSKNSPHSPKKQNFSEKHFSLRKTVKQVSFQHSSIHAVRSFSASFPARRGSVGANLLLDGAAKKLQKSLEKRGQPDEGLAEAKRRLLQHETVEVQNVFPEKTPTVTPSPTADDQMTTNSNQENIENQNGGQEAATETTKEKKCWETYCRMTKSGLNVSYDTILRGMLTPTEYRLRRRLSLEQVEDDNNTNNTQNENKTITNEE